VNELNPQRTPPDPAKRSTAMLLQQTDNKMDGGFIGMKKVSEMDRI
jgi:hypothetical protein